MRTFVYVCALTLCIAVLTPQTSAGVLGSDLQNGVAVYYFSSLTNSGNVFDQSGNGLRGALFSGAQLSTVSGRNCLFLKSNPADFQAWHDNRSFAVSKAFSQMDPSLERMPTIKTVPFILLKAQGET